MQGTGRDGAKHGHRTSAVKTARTAEELWCSLQHVGASAASLSQLYQALQSRRSDSARVTLVSFATPLTSTKSTPCSRHVHGA